MNNSDSNPPNPTNWRAPAYAMKFEADAYTSKNRAGTAQTRMTSAKVAKDISSLDTADTTATATPEYNCTFGAMGMEIDNDKNIEIVSEVISYEDFREEGAKGQPEPWPHFYAAEKFEAETLGKI
jgi:hypothetical protein